MVGYKLKAALLPLTSLALFLLASVSFAASARGADVSQKQPEPVLLDSVSHADAFAKDAIAKLQKDGVKDVELYHIGDEMPAGLRALARWLVKSGINVHFKKITLDELDKLSAEHQAKMSNVAPELLKLIRYEGVSPEPTKFRTEIAARIRHFFGIPGGMSFLTYVQKRTTKEKLVEGGVAITKASVTSLVLYYTLHAKALLDQPVNVMLPVAVSAAFSLGFDYWQRGNSAFKAQGADLDFETSKPVMNRKFYLVTAFIHSIVMREAIMAAAHITSDGFTMGYAAALAAFWTSAKGLFGKAPVELYIARGQKTRSPWWTIGWMTAWGTFYASLQILDLFDVGHVFREGLTVLGAVGLGFELYKGRATIIDGFKRFVGRLTGAYRGQRCETLLLAERPPAGNPLEQSPGFEGPPERPSGELGP